MSRQRLPEKLYRIGEVIEHSGLSRQTLHFYATLGLIREIDVDTSPTEVKMLLTTPFCPYGPWMVQQIKETAEKATETEVKVEVLAEQWHPEMMEDPTQLGFF